VRYVARVGERRGAFKFLEGEPEAKKPLGRPRRRWVDNIKMHLQELGRCMNLIYLVQYRDRWRTVVNAVMNQRFS